MDLVEILRARLDSLPPGDHVRGLRAVLQHIQAAVGHLTRGEKSADDTAFTDAIYRSNQAFEGSLKEAFRVLAGKDPQHVRPFEIETYLQKQNLLRSRVLAQFSTYRTEWRNPSTHDYRLDFDEDEALLAIVSVCAFAIVLVDQIAEKLNFDRARATAAPLDITPDTRTRALPDRIVDALLLFRYEQSLERSYFSPRESELIGAVGGYLSATLPEVQVETDKPLGERRARADLLVSCGDERVLLEIKRSSPGTAARFGFIQLVHYMDLAGVNVAIRFVYSEEPDAQLQRRDHTVEGTDRQIIVLAPVSGAPA